MFYGNNETEQWFLQLNNCRGYDLKGSEIIKNAWRKSGYSWFPMGNGVAAGEVVETAEAGCVPGDKSIEGNADK